MLTLQVRKQLETASNFLTANTFLADVRLAGNGLAFK